MNLIVKSIDIKHIESIVLDKTKNPPEFKINLEKSDPSEFINRFIGWFESMQTKLTKCIKSEDNEEEDLQHITQMFNDKAVDNLVPKEALKDLIKQSYKIEGREVPDEEIVAKIEQANI